MQRQRQPQPQYYTAITQFQDPDRLAKLLELGSPSLFDGGSSSSNSNLSRSHELPKLSSASVTTNGSESEGRLSKLLALGDVNFFGGSPMAEALVARQRGNR